MLSASLLLPTSAADQARGVPGIEKVIPIISQFVILDIHDEKVVAYMIGYEPDVGGGPWALPVLDNVAIVSQLAGLSRKAARQRARDLLEQLGLSHRLSFLPEKLSGGEKQRVAIARALVNQPDLILADEPTANLDSHHGFETMHLLRRIAKEEQRSVIIVSHDQRIKEIADRVLWLEDGEFKDTVELAVDPVCGMSVDRETAPARTDYNGQVFYFCAQGCKDEFLGNLEVYLRREEKGVGR
ncbi:MAG: Vitamin B12 import ATP-binding protein BtuD [Anaerolineae bacterium]|nr:Vitamin B12 import ATP-binding protein BtuD [Anaerolineae bacterium]